MTDIKKKPKHTEVKISMSSKVLYSEFDNYMFTIDKKFIPAASDMWRKLSYTVGKPLQYPMAGPTPEDMFTFTWCNPESPLSIVVDIYQDGSFEWFYRFKKSHKYGGSNDEKLLEIPEDLKKLLLQFCTRR